ncbi:MAG TPA: DNA replication and repair protein RecF, partial [Dehalococcoidia bacterium]|nr:DNA replication and repair protein RecF [Dehalococcoidia bacterium]
GPHRDDVTITLRGKSVSAYGSRAQQRSVVLALRLAEADLLRRRTGESPVLLLDDVFSELDPQRRSATALALGEAEQLIVTTADEGVIPSELSEPVARYRVDEGTLTAF